MRVRRMLGMVTLLVVSFVLSGPMSVRAGGKGKGGKGNNQLLKVKVEFRDLKLEEVPLDRVRSDSFGEYVDGVGKVSAWISRPKESSDISGTFIIYFLDAKGKKGNPRTICLDFTDREDSEEPNVLGLPFAQACGRVEITVWPDEDTGVNVAGGFFGLQNGPRAASMRINFHAIAPETETEELYTVRFSPHNYPNSSLGWVEFIKGAETDGTPVLACNCVLSDTDSCAELVDVACPVWEVTNDPAPWPEDDVGTLISDNSNDEGDYHLPFGLTITLLPQ